MGDRGGSGDRSAEATLTTVRSAVSFHRMDLTEAFRQAERSAALADALGVSTSLWVPEALWHALLSNTTGRSAEALAAAEDGIRITREQGRTAATRMWLMTRSRILLEAGRLTDARADAEAASVTTDDPGPGNLADVTLRYVMMRVALHTNDQQTARAYAAEARRMRSDGAPVVRHFGSWMLALMADFEGRPDRAMAELDAVMTSPAADRPAYAGLVDPADAPVLVRLALRGGAHERAAQAVALAERLAVLNPDLTFLAATAAHARGSSTTTSPLSYAPSGCTRTALGRWPGRRHWRTPDASWRPPARPKRCRTSTRPSRSTRERAPSGTSHASVGACGPPVSAAGPRRPDSPVHGPS